MKGCGGMTVSSKVKSVLALCDKRQIDLADHFGMTKQVMNNKMNRDSWSGKDLARVAQFVGGQLAFILPNGQQIFIDCEETEKGSDE